MSEVPSSPFGFAVNGRGECRALVREQDRLDVMGVSGSVSAGMDLLMDDGMPADQAAKMMLGAQRLFETQGGRDPEAMARHILKLRRALRP